MNIPPEKRNSVVKFLNPSGSPCQPVEFLSTWCGIRSSGRVLWKLDTFSLYFSRFFLCVFLFKCFENCKSQSNHKEKKLSWHIDKYLVFFFKSNHDCVSFCRQTFIYIARNLIKNYHNFLICFIYYTAIKFYVALIVTLWPP